MKQKKKQRKNETNKKETNETNEQTNKQVKLIRQKGREVWERNIEKRVKRKGNIEEKEKKLEREDDTKWRKKLTKSRERM